MIFSSSASITTSVMRWWAGTGQGSLACSADMAPRRADPLIPMHRLLRAGGTAPGPPDSPPLPARDNDGIEGHAVCRVVSDKNPQRIDFRLCNAVVLGYEHVTKGARYAEQPPEVGRRRP